MPEPKNWKRLALEGVVIVGSILLAFWIQAWWEGVQEIEERDALVALLRDDIGVAPAIPIQKRDIRQQHGRHSARPPPVRL